MGEVAPRRKAPPGLKLPGGAAAHCPPALLVCPGAQGAQKAAAADELAPGGQALQAGEPAPAKVPELQGTHVALEEAPVAAEAVPAGQGVGAAAPGGQKAPAGQVTCGTSHTSVEALPQELSLRPCHVTSTQLSLPNTLLGSPVLHHAVAEVM